MIVAARAAPIDPNTILLKKMLLEFGAGKSMRVLFGLGLIPKWPFKKS